MKKLSYAVLLTTILIYNNCLASAGDPMHPESPVARHDKLFIEAAMLEFNKHMKNIDQYNITVLQNELSVTVLFLHVDRPEGSRGGPGFEVEMDKKTLRIFRAHFVR